ncbi:serine hydrolase [Hydrogenophaga sp. PAMC20947]|uniref:serine hydrolase n=1 Tax=Hydrogenophaga sp. PAMC20947 TaxID=2565558 RepID=UPI00109E1936|nr:serine hydrolase [Hydrogenophaga sp. PAMC20947]QCB45370.1 D-alanyl-D-alanine carboxypeptidase [Hydrogenophaga sp. PAMC20947]
MNLLQNRGRKVWQALCCSMLATVLVVPMGAFAASGKTAPSKKQRVVASKATERRKVVTTHKVKSGKVAVKSSSSNPARLSREDARKVQRLAQRAKGKVRVSSKTSTKVSSKARLSLAAHLPSVKSSVMRVSAVPQLSRGDQLGLRGANDALELNSNVALVIDQETGEVLFSKNDSAVLPIASLTKLMTGLVIADAQLPMDEMITITQDDVDTHKFSRSRLAVGTTLSRGELMHLALMSSENRAANSLGRTFPGGLARFVALMNSKARDLGMNDTRYVEPTGLMSQNQSSARDLATLVAAAYERPILRDLSTSPSHELALGSRTLRFNNSNRLIRNPEWDIGLQKTGYISEAGRCMVMQAKVAGRKLIMVFLDSDGRLARSQDAERVRHWVEAQSYQRPAVRPQG